MLTIKQPTSSTTLYSISTHTPSQTLAAHFWTSGRAILRVIALGLSLAALYIEYEYLVKSSGDQQSWMLSSLRNAAPNLLASSSSLRLLCPLGIAVLGLWVVFRRSYKEETLLVVRGLGVQTSTSSSSYLLTSTTRFIPTTAIQDIFIHEAFIGFTVRYYLSIVVENEAQVVVVFPVRRASTMR